MCYLHANPKGIQPVATIARVESEHSQAVLFLMLHIFYHCFVNNSSLFISLRADISLLAAQVTGTDWPDADVASLYCTSVHTV